MLPKIANDLKVPTVIVAEALSHASLETTTHYVQAKPDVLADRGKNVKRQIITCHGSTVGLALFSSKLITPFTAFFLEHVVPLRFVIDYII